MLYQSKISYPNSEDYYEHYKYNLIKFKPQIDKKESAHRGAENPKENIISLQYEHIEYITTHSNRIPKYLQVKLDTIK